MHANNPKSAPGLDMGEEICAVACIELIRHTTAFRALPIGSVASDQALARMSAMHDFLECASLLYKVPPLAFQTVCREMMHKR